MKVKGFLGGIKAFSLEEKYWRHKSCTMGRRFSS